MGAGVASGGLKVVRASRTFASYFDQPSAVRGRGGDLDPAIWATGRIQPSNIGQPGYPNWTRLASINGGSEYPPDDSLIVGGKMLMGSVIQNYGNTDRMIRQPFDFEGRTGRVVFHVDAVTEGSLGSYVQFAITADPILCPTFLAAENDETGPLPRHALILPFRSNEGLGTTRVQIAEGCVYEGYSRTVLSPGFELSGTECPAVSAGSLNRIEIRVSQSLVSVYMSDYSQDGGVTYPNLQPLYQAVVDLPFEVGYVHLAARNHASVKYHLETTWVYTWDQISFDGPEHPVPRAYELPDNDVISTITGDPDADPPEGNIDIMSLGYDVPGSGIGPLTFNGSVNVAGATSAQLSLNAFMQTLGNTATTSWGLMYRFNGGTWRTRFLTSAEAAAANTAGTGGLMGLLIDLNLADLQQGTNTIEFDTDGVPLGYQPMVANVDLLVHV